RDGGNDDIAILNSFRLPPSAFRLPVSPIADRRFDQLFEAGLQVGKGDTVLRSLGSRNVGLNGGEIESQHLAVVHFTRLHRAEAALQLVVRLGRGNLRFGAAGLAQVGNG